MRTLKDESDIHKRKCFLLKIEGIENSNFFMRNVS